MSNILIWMNQKLLHTSTKKEDCELQVLVNAFFAAMQQGDLSTVDVLKERLIKAHKIHAKKMQQWTREIWLSTSPNKRLKGRKVRHCRSGKIQDPTAWYERRARCEAFFLGKKKSHEKRMFKAWEQVEHLGVAQVAEDLEGEINSLGSLPCINKKDLYLL